MSKSTTKTFTIEYETGLTKADRDLCEKKLRIASNIYNAYLGEALKRYNAYKTDNDVTFLLKLYGEHKQDIKALKEDNKKRRKEGSVHATNLEEIKVHEETLKRIGEQLNAIQRKYGWGYKYCMNDFILEQRHHFKGGIGSMIVTNIANRAIRTVEKHDENMKEYKVKLARLKEDEPTPKKPRVNFVKKGEDFSFEGSDNDSGIYYRDGELIFKKGQSIAVDTSKICSDPYYEEAMKNRIKYCRLISRTIRGKKRYYVQLCMEGVPPITKGRTYGDDKIDILDIKISHMDLEKQNKKETIELAPGCKNPEEKIAEIDRKMDASKRATNPDNFNEDGTCKKGPLEWKFSNNYYKLKSRRAELYRKMAERRKISHEILANKMLAEGTDIKIKHLSYKEQQKRSTKDEINPKTGQPMSKARQGKNIGNRAPSEFISILNRKLSYIDKHLIDES